LRLALSSSATRPDTTTRWAGKDYRSTLRDVRIVRDLLVTEKNWNEAAFLPYVEEGAGACAGYARLATF
jgi:hypothetical protein